MPDPLQALPSEIWIQCIELAIHGQPAGVLELIMVSKLWEKCLLTTSTLWSHIYVQNGQDEEARVWTFLHLSRNCLLDIDIMTILPTTESLILLEPHISRIKTVSIRPGAPLSTTPPFGQQWVQSVAYIMATFFSQAPLTYFMDASCVGNWIRESYPWQYYIAAMRFNTLHSSNGPASKDSSDMKEYLASISTEKTLLSLWRNHITSAIEIAAKDPLDLSGQVVLTDGRVRRGGIVTVHPGLLQGKRVAIKVFRGIQSWALDEELYEFNTRLIYMERHVWAALKHPNISEFLGFSNDFSNSPALISTWYQEGNILQFISREAPPVSRRLALALDVSKGLQYLHQMRVVHRELKPANVLIDDDGVARICDFGLAGPIGWQGTNQIVATAQSQTIDGYTAPELLSTHDTAEPVVAFSSDIYALGSTILELVERLSARQFRANRGRTSGVGHPPAFRSESTRAMSELTDPLWDLLEACWAERLARPVIEEVVKTLDSLARALPATL